MIKLLYGLITSFAVAFISALVINMAANLLEVEGLIYEGLVLTGYIFSVFTGSFIVSCLSRGKKYYIERFVAVIILLSIAASVLKGFSEINYLVFAIKLLVVFVVSYSGLAAAQYYLSIKNVKNIGFKNDRIVRF